MVKKRNIPRMLRDSVGGERRPDPYHLGSSTTQPNQKSPAQLPPVSLSAHCGLIRIYAQSLGAISLFTCHPPKSDAQLFHSNGPVWDP